MKKFTPQEDQFLKDNHLTIPAKRMAKMINRSEGTARQRMKSLGIIVPPEVIEIFRQNSYFKKGSIPATKGKKWSEYMSKEGQAASRKTTFKKGGRPANTLYDGCITIRTDKITGRKYKYIRLKKMKWLQYHQYKWRKYRGKIPKGHIVVFKDKDFMNCKLSNLELITMKENMLRNTIHNYPQEIVQVMQLSGVLTRKIRKYEKQNH